MKEQLLARIRAEFLDMPGLHLTLAQARRLWSVDEATCHAALDELVRTKFLTHRTNGSFCRTAATPAGKARMANAQPPSTAESRTRSA